ncbi:hypothetical protein HMPREF1370_02778 [Enterococcus faecium P1123]|nr:hypothetical protein HMPREF9524_00777 [Enterococcus faecium TX0133a01]EFR69873.1 hypothetical protein HMPREF9526_03152 [Enterococcus faecium TX0133B]EFR76339.1 hypothetical protein HMPREF9527_02791 [Enterococcus faecium TX0133C]EFS07113.1 hypothetical protein HMPREF9525_00844 [Enterococcus faecium TX0133a04]EJX74611.1 hypothetical protein HMPREF1372_02175 [Enterococcus faecium P1139]EJX76515.1 hypothetical protein HMPREF1370_02778 [Enterococcus faecium P1123]EJY32487.1 hypothetical protein
MVTYFILTDSSVFSIKSTPRNLNTFLNTIRKPVKMNYHQ